MKRRPASRQRRFTGMQLLMTIAIVAVVTGLLLPAMQELYASARAMSQDDLRALVEQCVC